MLRSFSEFFYLWVPLILAGTLVILALPWLAVIALLALVVAALVALGSLVMAFVAGVRALAGALGGSGKQRHASQWLVLEPSHVGTPAAALSPATPLYSSALDQTELLEEAGINPIDVYEHPYLPIAWRTSETAPGRESRLS